MIANAQKAIQTAQTVLPMVQQFGPLIKNAPAIISVLKSMQASEETASKETEESEEESDEAENEQKKEQTETKQADTGKEKKNKAVKEKKISWDSEDFVTRPSRPRMYI